VRIHCVAFVTARYAEIRDGSAFREAARFCDLGDATVVIRCEETGRDIQVSCTVGLELPAARFRREWLAKHLVL
jgi:hypothetical protein